MAGAAAPRARLPRGRAADRPPRAAARSPRPGRRGARRRSRVPSGRDRRTPNPPVVSVWEAPVSSAPASDQTAVRAAYGLRFHGVDGGGYLPSAHGEPWPEVRVEFVDANDSGDWRFGLGGRRACLPVPGGWVRTEREDARETLRADEPLTEDLLVHP